MDRRRFLTFAAGGGMALAALNRHFAENATTPARAPGCKVFTVEQAVTVEAICEQIVPSDDYPGAKAAGVLYFIDDALADPLARFRPRYDDGLELVNRVSETRFGDLFSRISSGQQITLLGALESGEAAGTAGQELFSMIRRHTMQGYYGDPQLGGNHGGVSWKMLNFSR
jgi:gluconate 2-dehydrogenase gamma chain